MIVIKKNTVDIPLEKRATIAHVSVDDNFIHIRLKHPQEIIIRMEHEDLGVINAAVMIHEVNRKIKKDKKG